MIKISIEDFANLVKQMRAFQKQYFKTRDKDVLIESKRLENLVDKSVVEILKEA